MAESTEASSISDFMKNVLESYSKIRGRKLNEHDIPFWDAVLISSSDASQEKGYQLEIEEKLNQGELPLNVPFHVFSDPPGYKIGCGGSALHVLEKVEEMYGKAMLKMRFLFLPAGGYSQRLPNLSVSGKLFSPLPFGDTGYQMLDLVLACYLPLLKNMPAGVFVASSDAVISYSLLDFDSWTFGNEGFTALAHPSPVHVGTTHGVYVLPRSEIPRTEVAFLTSCLQVLQKPTLEEMKEAGAIVESGLICGSGDQEDFVYSDSAFFFDHTISSLLIEFHRTHKPIQCELSSYGDFLTPLGNHSTERGTDIQSKLHRHLQDKKLSVLVLSHSNFYHLGTMTEYIENLCGQNSFFENFHLSKFSLSALCEAHVPSNIRGTIIQSLIHPSSIVESNSILEHCDVGSAINVSNNCIISNIQFNDPSACLCVPANTLLHTVLLSEGFVTVAFNIDADLKQTYRPVDSLEVQYFNRRLGDIFMSDEGLFNSDCKEVSLWNAKLFPLCTNSSESVRKTLDMVLCIETCSPLPMAYTLNRSENKWLSMCNVLTMKDTEGMVGYQKRLRQRILSTKHKLV